jgi:flagellar motor component MotA
MELSEAHCSHERNYIQKQMRIITQASDDVNGVLREECDEHGCESQVYTDVFTTSLRAIPRSYHPTSGSKI